MYLFLQQQVCIQSVTVVLDEDVSRQITLTREGEVIMGVNPAPILPYADGRNQKMLFNTPHVCYMSHAVRSNCTVINNTPLFIFDHEF